MFSALEHLLEGLQEEFDSCLGKEDAMIAKLTKLRHLIDAILEYKEEVRSELG